MTKLAVRDTDIELLQPNSWNTNTVSPENEEKIKNSLERFGFFRPILVREKDGRFEIIGGEHRWAVAKSLGYTTVPVINLGDISDKKAKEIGLVDNGRYGDDDALQLAELLKELGDDESVFNFLPYSTDELESLFSATSISLDDLDIEGDDTLPDISAMKSTQTHQIMRFKIPLEDSDFVQRIIETVMKNQGFTDDDAMMNAGNALVYLLRSLS
ncbi:ParB N-terminal domain-containing protein [Oxalobacter sp. OttesenSCG-928-P03]|nr:ParB N-terminal domain-containing protein [Oxalobacter sp. OttesenSCG-928-P03]